jgi:4-diphosphocytidyl-2-C-methyl-D-erythritol kinase
VTKSISLTAHAKLNLALAVVGKRDDGYHELRSVFATIALSDDVRVAAHRRLEVRNTIRVDDEIATRAVIALAAASAHTPHAFVRIRKRIPVAAGLGGGSSDAAAVLRGLATLWGLNGEVVRSDGVDRPGNAVDLVKVAAEVGSDVPFFTSGSPVALVSGRGEHVKPLRTPTDPLFAVVLRPTLRLATKDVFAAHAAEDRGAAAHVDAMAEAFERGAVTPDLLRVHAANDLLAAATRRCEAIASWQATAAARGVALFLTGSGPTLFAIADDRADALRVARILRRAGLRAHAYQLAV